jgi:hypothetical protein
VLLYIIRRTYGWRKNEETISLAEIADGTGLNRRSVQRAVKDLEDKTLIVVRRALDPDQGFLANTYRLRHNDREGRDKESLGIRQNIQGARDTESSGEGLSVSRGRDTESHLSSRDSQEQTLTESARPMGAAESRASSPPTTDSDSLAAWAGTTATALGRPSEARQLATWASKQSVPLDILQAAVEVTQQQSGLKKPVAYLQTVAKVMAADREVAAEVGERKQADRKQAARAYGREVYQDKIIGGSWTSVESILAESYGRDLAAVVVRELRGE